MFHLKQFMFTLHNSKCSTGMLLSLLICKKNINKITLPVTKTKQSTKEISRDMVRNIWNPQHSGRIKHRSSIAGAPPSLMSLMVSPRGGGGEGRKKKRSTGDRPTIKLTFSRYKVLKTVLKLNEDDCYIIWHKKKTEIRLYQSSTLGGWTHNLRKKIFSGKRALQRMPQSGDNHKISTFQFEDCLVYILKIIWLYEPYFFFQFFNHTILQNNLFRKVKS